jgi:hypothetical protein
MDLKKVCPDYWKVPVKNNYSDQVVINQIFNPNGTGWINLKIVIWVEFYQSKPDLIYNTTAKS